MNGTNIANNRVTDTAAPFDIATDMDGQPRTAPRDVGADQKNS